MPNEGRNPKRREGRQKGAQGDPREGTMVLLPAIDETRQPRIIEKGKVSHMKRSMTGRTCAKHQREGVGTDVGLRSAQHVIVHRQTTLSSDNTLTTSNPQITVKL
jgi:hypothetical protein